MCSFGSIADLSNFFSVIIHQSLTAEKYLLANSKLKLKLELFYSFTCTHTHTVSESFLKFRLTLKIQLRVLFKLKVILILVLRIFSYSNSHLGGMVGVCVKHSPLTKVTQVSIPGRGHM